MNNDEFSSQDEFEAQWATARRRAGVPGPNEPGGSKALYAFPLLVVYAGLFFGPLGTAFAAMYTREWRIPPREAVALLAGGAATWMLVTGAKEFHGSMDPFALQIIRSSINFVFGCAVWIWLRRAFRETHTATPQTVKRTAIAVAAFVVLYFVMGPKLLINLGR